MPHNIRIIPRLDIKGPNLVKGIHLEGLRVLGNPEKFARYYYENGADELLYMDIVASLYERNSLHDIVRKTANEIFIPLTVGGGIRSTDDIRQILNAGADKVAVNTAAIKDPEFITKASRQFGASTIVVAIEAIKQPDGRYLAFIDCGREETGIEAVEWAQKAEELGAGEILLTSVDREGTGEGFDIDFVNMVNKEVTVPVVAHGGASSVDDVYSVIKNGNADAVSIASALHYDLIKSDIDFAQHEEGNTEFLKSGMGFSRIKGFELKEVKDFLLSNQIECRHSIENE